MNKQELDTYLEENEYLTKIKQQWEEEKQNMAQQWDSQEGDEEEKKKAKKDLEEVWLGFKNITGAPSDEAAWALSVPKDIQNELNTAMANNECNGIRTPHGYYYLTADKEGNNTLYVDSRWLKDNYNPDSEPIDYLKDIKNIIGDNKDNENFKVSDMGGEFKDLSVNDFYYKADQDYGLYESSIPTPKPEITGSG